MADIKRYSIRADSYASSTGANVFESGTGYWVSYPDHEAAIKAAVEKERNMWADVVSRNVSGDTLKKILDAFNQARGAAK